MKEYIIHSAMKEEVEPLIELLDKDVNYFKVIKCKNLVCYKSNNVKVLLYISDIGILNTAFSVQDTLNTANLLDCRVGSDAIFINIGSVGARGCYNIGDILRVGRCYNSDIDLSIFGYDKYEYPRVCKYYDLDGDTICYTQSRFLDSSTSIDSTCKDYVVDMELYGLLYAINRLHLGNKVLSYKIVTDVSDGELSKYEHEYNLYSLSNKLCNFIYCEYLLEV